MPGFIRIAEDCWQRGLVSKPVGVSQDVKAVDEVPFSENLLQLTNVRGYSDNLSVQYYRAMRPYPLGKAVCVIHDLREAGLS